MHTTANKKTEDNQAMVHIVDDDEAVRKALSFLMRSVGLPAREYASAEEFIEKQPQLNIGCLLLDIRMPGMSGLQLLEVLNNRNSTLPVIFITGHGDVSMAVEAMRAGAVDFVEKPFDNDYLILRVQDCLAECASLNSDRKKQLDMEDKITRLTRREKEVMNLMVNGKQNKLIARELGISTRTVEIHRAKVMDKLEAHSLSDVVRIAMQSEDFK